MGKLIVKSKERVVREYEFHNGDTINVGRESSNDIIFDDLKVSRVHARFFVRESKLFIADLFSRNGTLVNGNLVVGDLELFNGDVVNIGTSVITVDMTETQNKYERGDSTAKLGLVNTKIAAAQFRFTDRLTQQQSDLLQNSVLALHGYNIHQNPNWLLAWWHGESLAKMATAAVGSSIEILKKVRSSIPSLNIFIFSLSAFREEQEPEWKMDLMGDPIKICEEFHALLEGFPAPIVTEQSIRQLVSEQWKFNLLASIRFKKNIPPCDLFMLDPAVLN